MLIATFRLLLLLVLIRRLKAVITVKWTSQSDSIVRQMDKHYIHLSYTPRSTITTFFIHIHLLSTNNINRITFFPCLYRLKPLFVSVR